MGYKSNKVVVGKAVIAKSFGTNAILIHVLVNLVGISGEGRPNGSIIFHSSLSVVVFTSSYNSGKDYGRVPSLAREEGIYPKMAYDACRLDDMRGGGWRETTWRL